MLTSYRFNATSFATRALICLTLIFTGLKSSSQTLSVGLLENLEDAYRRSQLLGLDTSNISYMIRPIHLTQKNRFSLTETDSDLSLPSLFKRIYSNANEKIELYALPVVWQQQFNSHHPYGINDGSMIQAKGYQTQLSAGVFFKAGPLSIQLRPELVYASNADFVEMLENDNEAAAKSAYIRYVTNRIDNPERFSGGAYHKLNWGQSSIRLNFGPMSFGLSNENLWWGPGVRNSLLMTNNADGFKHLTLNTIRPIKTGIGAFEVQVIGGRLDPSGEPVPMTTESRPKSNDWRYLSGATINYQPKWIPGLYLGFSRTFLIYKQDMGSSFFDYVPFLTSFEKLSSYDRENMVDVEDNKKRDQYFSFSARWVMPESKAEIYFEWGRNDHSVNQRDFMSEPEHSRAYVVGLKKLIPVRKPGEYIQTSVEFTQLESSRTHSVRLGPTWYAHHQVRAGYTNRGQIFGAGIGPGSNMQSLDVSWVNALRRIGVSFDRIVNNNDFFYNAGQPISDTRRHWVDLAVSGRFDWNYKKFTLTSGMTYIRSLNYQWRLKEDGGFFWDWPKQDVNNIQLKAGLLYNFN